MMDDVDFYIPCDSRADILHTQNVFATDEEFLRVNGLPIPKSTKEDQKEALAIFHQAPGTPPKPSTPGSAMALGKLLNKFDYVLDDPVAKMRNYVMFKFFELAEDPDPKVSMRALENLAKTADVGLFSERVEINITQKTTVDLEKDLMKLISGALKRPKTFDAQDAEFTSVE